jgi:hypothetical protein
MADSELQTALQIAPGFVFGQASPVPPHKLAALKVAAPPPPAPPPLGPLAAFIKQTFKGSGFNTIFRPHLPGTPTGLPVADDSTDNVLELNLTTETLSFTDSLGSVPNRGMVQKDLFLNGVPYLQTIQDVTEDPENPVGIHLEPGLWLCVGPTTDPAEGETLARMASIPHGTTIEAQGTSSTAAGKPTIPPVDITPFVTGSNPPNKIPFPSQTATNETTPRIPQDLAPFLAAGTITQAMLTDPNTVLRNHIAAQNITSTTTIVVTTAPASPLFGGGTDNIAFLLGNPGALTNPDPPGPNAQATQMHAVFWIETVQHQIVAPIFTPGQPRLAIPAPGPAGQRVPVFDVNPPVPIKAPRTITVTSTQIQYSQLVLLNFNGLTWPHASVATLVPSEALPVPPSVWG